MKLEDLENRFAFHPANTEEKRNEHTSVRKNCLELAKFINEKVPEGCEKALAITHLEEVMMWSNAGIARNNTEDDESILGQVKTHQFKADVKTNGESCICGEGWNAAIHT